MNSGHTSPGRALPRITEDLDPALVLLHDAIDRGQAHARALADLTGGEERLENAGARGLVHAVARICYTEAHELPLPRLRVLRGARGGDLHQARGHAQTTAAGHGVAGIDNEIRHHLFHTVPLLSRT